MTVLFFDQANGNDTTGTGSDVNPYKTLPKAGTVAAPGDECRFRPTGDYVSSPNTTIQGLPAQEPANAGTSGSPIVYTTDPVYLPTRAVFDLSAAELAHHNDKGHYQYKQLEFFGNGIGSHAEDFEIPGMVFEDLYGHDLDGQSSGNNYALLYLYRCISPRVRRCKLDNVSLLGQRVGQNASCIQSYEGRDILIEDSEFYRCNYGVYQKSPNLQSASGPIIRRSIFGGHTSAACFWSHDGSGGLGTHFDMEVSFCLFLPSYLGIGSYRHIAFFGHGPFTEQDSRLLLFNNTLDMSIASYGVELQGVTAVEYFNNLMCQATGNPYALVFRDETEMNGRVNSLTVCDKNWYHASSGTYVFARNQYQNEVDFTGLASWQGAGSAGVTTFPAGKDANSGTADPKLVDLNGYELQSDSPLIGAGIGNVDIGWKAFSVPTPPSPRRVRIFG